MPCPESHSCQTIELGFKCLTLVLGIFATLDVHGCALDIHVIYEAGAVQQFPQGWWQTWNLNAETFTPKSSL